MAGAKLIKKMTLFTWIMLLFILAVGCFPERRVDAPVQRADTVRVKQNSPPVQVAAAQDTAKKLAYSPPEINEEAMQKAVIAVRDSTFHVYNNIRADYRIIGYERPDTSSRKMVLFSVFTSDVEGNPFRCPYGAYYDSALGAQLVIKYTAGLESFIQARISGLDRPSATVYFENKWVEFDR